MNNNNNNNTTCLCVLKMVNGLLLRKHRVIMRNIIYLIYAIHYLKIVINFLRSYTFRVYSLSVLEPAIKPVSYELISFIILIRIAFSMYLMFWRARRVQKWFISVFRRLGNGTKYFLEHFHTYYIGTPFILVYFSKTFTTIISFTKLNAFKLLAFYTCPIVKTKTKSLAT